MHTGYVRHPLCTAVFSSELPEHEEQDCARFERLALQRMNDDKRRPRYSVLYIRLWFSITTL